MSDGVPMYRCGDCREYLKNVTEVSQHMAECCHEGPLVLAYHCKNELTNVFGYKKITFDKSVDDIKQLLRNGYGMEIDTEHKRLSFQGKESNMVFETTLPSTSVFSSPQEIALYEELLDLLPDAIKSLSIVDPKHSDRIKSMMKLMADGKFPYDNIAFLLFEDVIQWFVSGDVRSMRYSEEVRRFWLTGAQLFGNKYIEFCRGPGFKGIGVNDKHEPLTPAMSSINFAVPSRGNLQPRDTDRIIPQNLNPGILKEMIDVYINEHPNATTVSHNISGDLKKINRSKKDDLGMIDLSGFEPPPTKVEKEESLQTQLDIIDGCISFVEKQMPKASDINSLTPNNRKDLKLKFHSLLTILAYNTKSIRKFLGSKEHACCKLIERASKESTSNEWRETRYAYGITAMKFEILQAKECIEASLNNSDRIIQVILKRVKWIYHWHVAKRL